MLTIFSDLFLTAVRNERDVHQQTHTRNRRPMKSWEVERLEAERRRRSMRNVGMW